MIEKLINYGFRENLDNDLMFLRINEKEDRFNTELIIYTDEIEKVYINQSKISGLITISEQDVLNNHNNLHDGVKRNYLNFKEKFPSINSAL